MKFVDEYRDPAAAKALVAEIERSVTQPWTLMEVCGGQTHTIVKYGIDELIPDALRLIHGPGCPVCVTPQGILDAAVEVAQRPEVIFCSFGDMLRVPGTQGDLLSAKAAGADVRTVYAPLDAVAIAEANPDREVVFLAVGFETTAPANALAVRQAAVRGVGNFSLLISHVLVPPAMTAILSDPDNRVQGFLAAGHVCTVMGTGEYKPIVQAHGVPIVVTGFEPLDLLEGILMCVQQLEAGQARVDNQYARSVRADGNPAAQAMITEVFEPCTQSWRGMGDLPGSGLRLRAPYTRFDACRRFQIDTAGGDRETECIAGEVLTGRAQPADCPAFGKRCTPENPLGAPMVSSEGACAAYYRYRSRTPAATAS